MLDLSSELAKLDFAQVRYRPPSGRPKGQAGALKCARDKMEIAAAHERVLAPKAQPFHVPARVALLNTLSRHSIQSLKNHGFKIDEPSAADLLPAA